MMMMMMTFNDDDLTEEDPCLPRNVLKRLQATIPGCAEPDWCRDDIYIMVECLVTMFHHVSNDHNE